VTVSSKQAETTRRSTAVVITSATTTKPSSKSTTATVTASPMKPTTRSSARLNSAANRTNSGVGIGTKKGSTSSERDVRTTKEREKETVGPAKKAAAGNEKDAEKELKTKAPFSPVRDPLGNGINGGDAEIPGKSRFRIWCKEG
jgi:hypothetical protein